MVKLDVSGAVTNIILSQGGTANNWKQYNLPPGQIAVMPSLCIFIEFSQILIAEMGKNESELLTSTS